MGLKEFRSMTGRELRKANPQWGNPNKKRQARIEKRQKEYDAMSDKTSRGGHAMHRPGSWKRV